MNSHKLTKIPAKRINRIQQYTLERAVRRKAQAKRFRKQLRVALAAKGNTSAPEFAQEVLIDAATFAFVEHSELMARFLSGRALNREMLRLHSVRSQLVRSLTALGLAALKTEPTENEPAGAALEEWAEKRREREQKANGGVPVAVAEASHD